MQTCIIFQGIYFTIYKKKNQSFLFYTFKGLSLIKFTYIKFIYIIQIAYIKIQPKQNYTFLKKKNHCCGCDKDKKKI